MNTVLYISTYLMSAFIFRDWRNLECDFLLLEKDQTLIGSFFFIYSDYCILFLLFDIFQMQTELNNRRYHR